MTDPTPSPEAIEKAARALYAEVTPEYAEAAAAALSAAYAVDLPALRAQIIRELAEDARAEAQAGADALDKLPLSAPWTDRAPHLARLEYSDYTHRWLSARTETKENQ
jgi:hypothetical protein